MGWSDEKEGDVECEQSVQSRKMLKCRMGSGTGGGGETAGMERGRRPGVRRASASCARGQAVASWLGGKEGGWKCELSVQS